MAVKSKSYASYPGIYVANSSSLSDVDMKMCLPPVREAHIHTWQPSL